MAKGFLVTVEELENDPWKLEAKLRSLTNIELWKKHYQGKRVSSGIKIKPWRDKIEQLEREIKKAHRQAISKRKEIEHQRIKDEKELEQFIKFHERVIQFHHSVVDKCMRLTDRNIVEGTSEYDLYLSIAARALGNDIHDFTEVKTGLMTLNCFYAATTKSTPEHFWPRSVVGGRDIIEQCLLMKDKFSIRHTIRTLFQLCQTVESLNTENRDLMKHQKAYTFIDPQTAYDAAGIRLVRVKDFSLHSNWSRIFKEYRISHINPYEFSTVLTVDEAENMRKEYLKSIEN